MNKKEIFQIGFVEGFIHFYYEMKTYCHYHDKDRLAYALCKNEKEKKKITKKKIKEIKSKIYELGFEELSAAYLIALNPESNMSYIQPQNRYDFWLKRFIEEYDYAITSFTPITDIIFEFFNVSELSADVLEREDEFWEWFPKDVSPKEQCLLSIIITERELFFLIEHDIEQYFELENWEFYFEEYENLIDYSKPLEILFNLCELFVQLQRFETFNEFLEINKETLPPKRQMNLKSAPVEMELSERIKKHFGFFNRNCPRKHKQILSDTDFEKLIEWTIWYFENNFEVPKISEPINVVNTNKTFVQLAFRYLFKELNKNSPYPKTLFKLYQSAFSPYSEERESNFYAASNNDEVKKLMQIDY